MTGISQIPNPNARGVSTATRPVLGPHGPKAEAKSAAMAETMTFPPSALRAGQDAG